MGGSIRADRSRLRLLLGSSSVVALLAGSGSAYAQCSSSPTNSTTTACIVIQNTTVGDVINTGTISPGGPDGIQIDGSTGSGATVTGAIVNQGNITATTGIGINVINNSVVSGGINNSNTISGSSAGIAVNNGSTFGGGITNSGGITSTTGPGVFVNGVSTFSGGITNSNSISGLAGIVVAGPTSGGFNSGTFSGGITNSGSISAPFTGISVQELATFSGNIVNATGGTITAGTGIFVGCSCGISTFTGSIINSGTISATNTGIKVANIQSFIGGITNSGTISVGGRGIFVGTSGGSPGIGTFSGGVTNSGTISSTGTGISLANIGTFAGGILNSGTISAAFGAGIAIGSSFGGTVSSFAGGITNSGTISAAGGIVAVGVSTFIGGITNSGTILARTGIFIDSGSVFSGGITNGGTISARSGIVVQDLVSFAGNVSNSGSITGQSGIVVGCSCGISTFAGSIINSGTITSTRTAISVFNVTSFLGGITNSGTITAGGIGIFVGTTSGSPRIRTFGGGIVNSGTISGTTGILVSGVSLFTGGITNTGTILGRGAGIVVGTTSGSPGVRTFTGGIVNTGTIAAGTGAGILVDTTRTFSGGIANSGAITSTSATGILVSGVSVFSGGIANGGTILAATVGIGVGGIQLGSSSSFIGAASTFIGGITNNGTISAGAIGILVGGIGVGSGSGFSLSITTFSGGITNTGTISAGLAGILVGGLRLGSSGIVPVVSTFSGGITNSGLISAGGAGIAVAFVPDFSGGIANIGSGRISASGTGINVTGVSNFTGGISNGGTITAGSDGILLAGVSNFAGGVTNTGTVSAGGTGILIAGTPSVSVFNSGTITGGGTAIRFDSGINTLTLGPGFVVNGNVLGVGNDIFQLGGTGTGAFNLDTIGTQYTGFSTFNVVGATWVATGTGNQNWSISSGATLQLGNGGTSGTINGNIADNGTFAVNHSDTFVFGGTISGTGNFVQLGSGTTVLTANNTYTGGSILTAGALQVTNNSSVGTGTVTLDGGSFQSGAAGLSFANPFAINAGGGTVDTQANTLTLAGPIANGNATTGALTKIGSGTLILTGSSSYTGPTNVNAGILQAGATGVFAPLSTYTVGAGAAIDLHGFNQILGGLAGNGSVLVGAATLGLGGNNASTSFGGALSGTGQLVKTGTGTLTLTGNDSAFSGNTLLSAGGLQVGAATSPGAILGGSVAVQPGGILSGHGTILGSIANNGGTVSPGGSVGTLAVAGNFVQAANGTLQIELTPPAASKVAVGGAASLAGTLVVAPVPGSYVPFSRYPIVTATGGVSGAFSQIIETLPVIPVTAQFLPNEVDLVLGGFAGLTRNQNAVAGVLNSAFSTASGDFATALGLAVFLPANQMPQTLASLGGQIYANLAEVSLQDRRLFLGAMDERLRLLDGGGAPGAAVLGGMIPGGWGGGANARQMAALGSAISDTQIAAVPASGGPAPALPANVWARGFGQFGSLDSNGGALGADYSTGGGAVGAELYRDPQSLFGVAVSGGQSNVSTSTLPERGTISFVQVGAYGARALDYGATLDGAVIYAHDFYDVSRGIVLPGLSRTATSHFGGDDAVVDLGVSRPFLYEAWKVTPRVGFSYFHIGQSNFSESGANSLDLTVNPASLDALRSRVGVAVSQPMTIGETALLPELRAAWTHDFLNDRGAFNAAFTGAPGVGFQQIGAATGRDAAELGAGISFAIAQTSLPGSLSAFVQYDATIAKHQTANTVAAGLKLTW